MLGEESPLLPVAPGYCVVLTVGAELGGFIGQNL